MCRQSEALTSERLIPETTTANEIAVTDIESAFPFRRLALTAGWSRTVADSRHRLLTVKIERFEVRSFCARTSVGDIRFVLIRPCKFYKDPCQLCTYFHVADRHNAASCSAGVLAKGSALLIESLAE